MVDINRVDLRALAAARIEAPDPNAMLLSCRTNEERRDFCRAMMEHYRTRWYRGKQETQDRLLALRTRSDRIRWGLYTPQTRATIAAQIWGKSPTARDFADQEQMFWRWALYYQSAIEKGVVTT